MAKDITPTNLDEQAEAKAAEDSGEQRTDERKAERKAMGIRHP